MCDRLVILLDEEWEDSTEDMSSIDLKIQQLSDADTKKAQRLGLYDGFFASMSDNLTGPFNTAFALALGATKFQIGLLSGLTVFFTNFSQIFGARLSERAGRRKVFVVAGNTIARSLWVLGILIPVFFRSYVGVYVFIALLAMRAVFAGIGVPAWTSLMADVVEKDERGRYFSTRNTVIGVSAFVATMIASKLLQIYGFPLGYQYCFCLAALVGLGATISFVQMPEPRSSQDISKHVDGESESALTVFLSETNVVRYCVTSMLLYFGVSVGGPLITVYLIESMGAPDYFLGYFTASGTVLSIVGQRFWGRLVDRYSQKSIMLLCGVGVSLIPINYLLFGDYRFSLIANAFGTFVWAGYNLAAFNFILDIIPAQRNTIFIATFNACIGVAQLIGPLVGGIMSDYIGIPIVLVASGVLRFTALFLFRKIVDGKDAFRKDFSVRKVLRDISRSDDCGLS